MVNFVRDLNKNEVINEMHFISILFMSSRYLSVSLAWHHRYSLTYTDIAQYLKLIVAEPTIQTGESEAVAILRFITFSLMLLIHKLA